MKGLPSSAPPSSRNPENTFPQRPKPLQRVQPLQIQSPSVINVLKQGVPPNQSRIAFSGGECSGSSESTYNSSSEENQFSSIESQNHEETNRLFGFTHLDRNSSFIVMSIWIVK